MSFAPPDANYADDLRQQIEHIAQFKGTSMFHVIPFEHSQHWHRARWDVTHLHNLIIEADAFLAIHSQSIMLDEYAPWLRYEYGFAVFRHKNSPSKPFSLVRVIGDDLTVNAFDMPIEFSDFHTVDYRDIHSQELSLDNLVKALCGSETVPEALRRRYVFNEAIEPNPRWEMMKRVFETEFERSFKIHIGPLQDKVQHLTDLQRAQDNLMTPEIISIEEAKAFDDIWVVSHSLHNDLEDDKIVASINENLERGIDYTYFLPKTPLIRKRRKKFEDKYRNYCSPVNRQDRKSKKETGRIGFIPLDQGVFMPFDELVVYDAESATNRWGYIQMNYDRATGHNAASGLVMKVPDRTLSTIIEFLSELRRQTEPHSEAE